MTTQLYYCPNPLCRGQHLWPSVDELSFLCPRCDVTYVLKDGVVVVKTEWGIVKEDKANGNTLSG